MVEKITVSEHISRLNLHAVHGLQTGNFSGLIGLLDKYPNQMSERLIQVLILMMQGNDQKTEHILELKPNKTFGDSRNLPYRQQQKEGREWFIALFMVRAIHLDGILRKQAENEAHKLFGVSYSAAGNVYDTYKARIIDELKNAGHDLKK